MDSPEREPGPPQEEEQHVPTVEQPTAGELSGQEIKQPKNEKVQEPVSQEAIEQEGKRFLEELKQRLGDLWQAYQTAPDIKKDGGFLSRVQTEHFVAEFALDIQLPAQSKLELQYGAPIVHKLGGVYLLTVINLAKLLIKTVNDADEGKQLFMEQGSVIATHDLVLNKTQSQPSAEGQPPAQAASTETLEPKQES